MRSYNTNCEKNYEIVPIADLRPVCPNCHTVIYMGGQTRSIEEVKSLINRASALQ